MSTILNLPVKFGRGRLTNTLKMLAQEDSSCYTFFGYDLVNNTGAIVANGKLVSSKILDVKLERDEEMVDGAYTVNVVYVDVPNKTTSSRKFDVISQEGVEIILLKYDNALADISTSLKDVSTYAHRSVTLLNNLINNLIQQITNLAAQISSGGGSGEGGSGGGSAIDYSSQIAAINSSIYELYDMIEDIRSREEKYVDFQTFDSSIRALQEAIQDSGLSIDSSIIEIINSSISLLDTSVNRLEKYITNVIDSSILDIYDKLSNITLSDDSSLNEIINNINSSVLYLYLHGGGGQGSAASDASMIEIFNIYLTLVDPSLVNLTESVNDLYNKINNLDFEGLEVNVQSKFYWIDSDF